MFSAAAKLLHFPTHLETQDEEGWKGRNLAQGWVDFPAPYQAGARLSWIVLIPFRVDLLGVPMALVFA